jgi:hypothetical protein
MSFGIHIYKMPVDHDGKLLLGDYQKVMEQRYIIEAQAALQDLNTGRIEIPTSVDVVLGRGRPYQEYPGNRRLADIIDEYRTVYQASSRREKTVLSNKILSIIKDTDSGGAGAGRFLKKCEGNHGGWLQVSDDIAREKVSHSFRTKTRRSVVVTPPSSLLSDGIQEVAGEAAAACSSENEAAAGAGAISTSGVSTSTSVEFKNCLVLPAADSAAGHGQQDNKRPRI